MIRGAVRLVCRSALFSLIPSALFAQPSIFPRGVVNAASFLPANSPGGAIAQGSIFTIFGTGLGPPLPGVQATSFPIPTTLGGVSVALQHQSGAGGTAFLLFVSSTQINALLPSFTPVGLVSVRVSFEGRLSAAEPIKVARSSFGVFTVDSSGAGAAIVQNYVSPSELPLNSPANAAGRGQTVILWGTGLGPISGGDGRGPAPGALAEPIEVTVAGRPVAVDYAGRSGCCAGVDQVQFRVPDGAWGCTTTVAVKVQNGVWGNLTTISADPTSGICLDPWHLPGSAQRWGEIALTPAMIEGVFAAGVPQARRPPPGECTSVALRPPGTLNAGSQLTLEGPQGTRAAPRNAMGRYFGGLVPGAGNYTVTGAGGPDVGPFQAAVTAAPALAWTVSGSRSRGLTVNWTGAGAGPVIEISSVVSVAFTCTAVGAAGSFTVPPAALVNQPAESPISVGALSGAPFAAPGIDAGVITALNAPPRTVTLGEPPLAASPVRLPNGRAILAEVAANNAERQRGLMQRTELEGGMLFLFDRADFYSFWMYRTLIPLDIIWMDAERRIVFISAATPPCPSENSSNCPLYGGRERSQYVLEIGSGQAAQQGLRVGDRLEW